MEKSLISIEKLGMHNQRQWKKHSIFFAQYALKYYYSNSKSVFIFVTSVKVRTLLENTFENTVTVIVRK
jgi:hypothetical protein